VTHRSGLVVEEDIVDSSQVSQVVGASSGFIVSDASTADDDEGWKDETLEISLGAGACSLSEIQLRAAWRIKRDQIGDGFTCRCSGTAEANCGVFVLEKKKHEKKFDELAFLLSTSFNLKQVDSADVAAGIAGIDVLIFPGGSIFEVHDKMKSAIAPLAKWIRAGGGYVGICAGAFLAAADGYAGADPSTPLLGAAGSWRPGVGTAKVWRSDETNDDSLPSFCGISVPLVYPHLLSSMSPPEKKSLCPLH
jgi:hypothetical protein